MNDAPRAETPHPDAQRSDAQRSPLRVGFARGVAPAKWERRWRAASARPLELVPLDLAFGETSGPSADVDVVIMRTGHGATPAGSEGSARTRHAIRLYTESVALVVAAGHELAKLPAVSPAELALVPLLDHPDHAAGWPAAEPWADPSWRPAGPRAALELVATGAGGILLPLPLARHLTRKREHAVLPVRAEAGEAELAGSTVWAVWPVDRDSADVQQLAGILRGRTARSSRANPAPNHAAAIDAAHDAPPPSGRTAQTRGKKSPTHSQKKRELNRKSRGAQLAAAANARAAKKRKRR